MNAKQLVAAAAIAFAATAAFAIEAEQYNPPPSTLSRDEVKADMARAKVDPIVMSGCEATVFIDRPVAAARSRDDVRTEARAVAQAHVFNDLYVGA